MTAFAVGLAVRGTALYLTFPVLIAAYVLHFGGQALRAAQSAVGAVPARLGEAARLLGAPRWRRLGRVELPLMVPGLVAGGGLVMLSVLKELPITLILRPNEMTPTLAQRIYATAEEALAGRHRPRLPRAHRHVRRPHLAPRHPPHGPPLTPASGSQISAPARDQMQERVGGSSTRSMKLAWRT